MPFNLITDAWIPVRMADGSQAIIRPDQITEAGVLRPEWPRADFNLACYELLIGLVYLADPPRHARDWERRRTPDPMRLRDRLAALAPAFNLDGEGPRFLQDREDLNAAPNGVDMLFIDSSGGNTARNNADLMVRRDRYSGLSLAEGAMALFALQSQAPSGGAGNRTSMRGGGPLITLVQPEEDSDTPLWDMVWANVPEGEPLDPSRLEEALPWMRATETSEKGTSPKQPLENGLALAEAFFGMPRRLRLDFSDDETPRVVGVRQKPYGTNYGLWRHPLSPYYQQNVGSELLPMHPRPGIGSYRNWIGIAFERADGLRHVAETVRTWHARTQGRMARLHVGGWAMDNMKPRDFVWSVQPLFPLTEVAEDAAVRLVEAANALALALAGAMQTLTGVAAMDASAVEAVREAFYAETHDEFEALLKRLSDGASLAGIAPAWIGKLRKVALRLFEERALPGLGERDLKDAEAIVKAHGQLRAAFSGYGKKTGEAAFDALGLDLLERRKKMETAA